MPDLEVQDLFTRLQPHLPSLLLEPDVEFFRGSKEDGVASEWRPMAQLSALRLVRELTKTMTSKQVTLYICLPIPEPWSVAVVLVCSASFETRGELLAEKKVSTTGTVAVTVSDGNLPLYTDGRLKLRSQVEIRLFQAVCFVSILS